MTAQCVVCQAAPRAPARQGGRLSTGAREGCPSRPSQTRGDHHRKERAKPPPRLGRWHGRLVLSVSCGHRGFHVGAGPREAHLQT